MVGALMVQVLVDASAAKSLQSDLAAAQAGVPKQLHDAMETGLLLIERDARANVRQDTRALMGSISHQIFKRGTGVLEGKVGPSRRYGFWVEYGRRPGKMPPLQAIAGWAQRRGLNPFLVARAIGRRGTRPAPFMGPAFEKNERRIVDLFSKVGAAVVARLAGR